jgi:hypothetical protein
MPTSTERSQKHRARKRAGWGRFTLELPLAPLSETLVRAEWLTEEDRDDVHRLHMALERALREWCGVEASDEETNDLP